MRRFQSCCEDIRWKITKISLCHWIWFISVNPRAVPALAQNAQPYGRPHPSLSPSRTRTLVFNRHPQLFRNRRNSDGNNNKTFAEFYLGKTRYGICVNFYRPMERIGAAAGSGVATKRDKYNSTFRRESWRKSMEKSTDSAFSR